MAAFYGWVAAATTATTSYGVIAVQMVVYGLGMGLTSAPATESIMGAVAPRQAGVGSAVNDSTRLLGGTLGVAVIGSVYASLYGSRLTSSLPAALPGRLSVLAHQSVGAAYAVSGQVSAAGHPAVGRAIHARRHQRVPARPQRRLRGRRKCRGGRGRGCRGIPPRPSPRRSRPPRPRPGPSPGPRSSPGNPGRGQAESGFRFARLPIGSMVPFRGGRRGRW